MFDKLPIRIIKNSIIGIIIIVCIVNLFSIYVETTKEIAKQEKTNYKSDVIVLGGYFNKNTSVGSGNKQFESDIVVEEKKEKELESRDFNEIKVPFFKYIKFAIMCIILNLLIVYLCISKGQLYGFKETFDNGFRRVLLIIGTLVLTLGVMSLYVIYIGSYVKNLNIKMEKVVKEESELKYDGANKLEGGKTKEFKGTHKSVVSDESVFVVGDKAKLIINGAIIDKSGIDCFDVTHSKNYGINSAVLVVENGNLELSSSNVYADSKGSTGVFATGKNAIANVKNTKIAILGKEAAYGLSTSYDGKVKAEGIDIVTSGENCAALMGGKENGEISITGSSIKTYGRSGPIAYARSNILINEVYGDSMRSSAFMIEDGGSIQVDNSEVSSGLYGYNEDVDDAMVFLYSKSTDYENRKKAIFTINDSKLEALEDSSEYYKAPAFLITNTEANINIKNTSLVYGSRILFDVKAIRKYGLTGKNGGHANITAQNQRFVGFIKVDMDSTLEFALKDGSVYAGGINYLNSGSDKVELKVDSSSRVILTSHCYLTKFENEDSTNSNITFGKYKIFVNGEAIN